jgi:hypothetical protein
MSDSEYDSAQLAAIQRRIAAALRIIEAAFNPDEPDEHFATMAGRYEMALKCVKSELEAAK